MDLDLKDLIDVLWFLLPGLVSAWVFEGLTSRPKPTQFDRIVSALIFTAFIQLAVAAVRRSALMIGTSIQIGEWTRNIELFWSILLAILLGLILTKYSYSNHVHRLLQSMRITIQNSYPSEWFSAFTRTGTNQPSEYVVLHLEGERRLFGWPEEWPVDPSNGHFVITDAEWLPDDPSKASIKLEEVSRIVVPARAVEMVEFVRWPEEPGTPEGGRNGDETKPTASPP